MTGGPSVWEISKGQVKDGVIIRRVNEERLIYGERLQVVFAKAKGPWLLKSRQQNVKKGNERELSRFCDTEICCY